MVISRLVGEAYLTLRDHLLFSTIADGVRSFLSERFTAFFAVLFVALILLGIFGPSLAPHTYNEFQRDGAGDLKRLESPSLTHPLGTTEKGYDVFSRLIYGAQATLLTGFVGGLIIVSVGLSIGVTSGYVGGQVEEILMRFTDFMYGLPLIPIAILFVAYFGMGFWQTILLIGLLLWRGNARVFRSQVLQIKEREYVKAAELQGASRRHIVLTHILPNMGGMVVLFLALGAGATILIEAGLAFLGLTSPFVPTWGIMLRNVYQSGNMTSAWWWTIPPGFMIALTVLTTFMIGRGYERLQEEAEQEGGAAF